MQPRLTVTMTVVGLISTAAVAANGGAPRQLAWGMTDCDFAIAFAPVEPDRLQPQLPDGFVPTVPESVAATLPPDPRLEAVIGAELLTCTSGVGLDGTIEDLVYASIWTFVDAPADVADPAYPLRFVKWETLVPDADRRQLLQAAGVPARGGSVDAATFVHTPAGSAVDVAFTIDGFGATSIVGTAAAPNVFVGDFIEYSSVPDGLVEWRTHYDASLAHGGGAVLSVPADSWVAGVLGASTAQAYLLAGDGLDFTEASITLPRAVASYRDTSSDQRAGAGD